MKWLSLGELFGLAKSGTRRAASHHSDSSRDRVQRVASMITGEGQKNAQPRSSGESSATPGKSSGSGGWGSNGW